MARGKSISAKHRKHMRDIKVSHEPNPSSYFAAKAILCSILVACVGGLIAKFRAHGNSQVSEALSLSKSFTLGAVLTMPKDELANADIATMNLLCAQGLPGAQDLDVQKDLAILNIWTDRVRHETDRHLYRVTDPRYADHYQHSEAKFRAEMLVQVLQEDLNVHYNMDRVERIDFTNSKDLFIHGMINDSNGGTCVSMPVLYTAIARRLRYPVKLVEAKAHLFCRWEGIGPDGEFERFNFDGAGKGFGIFDDSYYRNWPKPVTENEIARGEYLKSLSPSEELAVFLAARGHCLLDTGHIHEAEISYAEAHRLHPAVRDYFNFLVDSIQREASQDPAIAINLNHYRTSAMYPAIGSQVVTPDRFGHFGN